MIVKLSGALCALLLSVAAARAQPAAEAPCRVMARDGQAVALRGDQAYALFVGAPVETGDTIQTAATAKLRLQCANGLDLTIGPDTKLVVARYLAADSTRLDALFELLRGIIRLVGDAGAGTRSIAVETDLAVASVRSTTWVIERTAAGTGELTLEGQVDVRARGGGAVTVGPGYGTDVTPGNPPVTPRIWPEPRRRSALERTTLTR